MKLMKKMVVMLVALVGYMAQAQAVVVYDEAVNGDLSEVPATLIHLSLGTNTIFASSAFSSGVRDADSFLFQLDPGFRTVGGIYAVLSRNLATNTTVLHSSYRLFDSSLDLLGNYDANVRLNGDQSIFGRIGEGIYGVDNYSFDRRGGGGVWDYSITITVESVPEPESLTLAGLGLFVLAAGSLRRRKS